MNIHALTQEHILSGCGSEGSFPDSRLDRAASLGYHDNNGSYHGNSCSYPSFRPVDAPLPNNSILLYSPDLGYKEIMDQAGAILG